MKVSAEGAQRSVPLYVCQRSRGAMLKGNAQHVVAFRPERRGEIRGIDMNGLPWVNEQSYQLQRTIVGRRDVDSQCEPLVEHPNEYTTA